MRILVDGDCIVYRAAWAAQKTKYRVWLDDDTVTDFDYKKDMLAAFEAPPKYETYEVFEPVENALSTVKGMLNGISSQFGQNDLEIYIGGSGNFRDQVATVRPYKGKRPPKPKHYATIREYLVKWRGATVTEGEEADDALSIAQYSEFCAGRTSVIVTIDKDLNMVPGLHYNFVKKEQFYVEEDAAMEFFFHQLITGDPTDNIVGVPGAGPAAARKLLDGLPHDFMWEVIKDKYEEAYGLKWEAMLLEMGRLLWMRREPNEMWELPLYF